MNQPMKTFVFFCFIDRCSKFPLKYREKGYIVISIRNGNKNDCTGVVCGKAWRTSMPYKNTQNKAGRRRSIFGRYFFIYTYYGPAYSRFPEVGSSFKTVSVISRYKINALIDRNIAVRQKRTTGHQKDFPKTGKIKIFADNYFKPDYFKHRISTIRSITLYFSSRLCVFVFKIIKLFYCINK